LSSNSVVNIIFNLYFKKICPHLSFFGFDVSRKKPMRNLLWLRVC
jgi:hypothetical protein